MPSARSRVQLPGFLLLRSADAGAAAAAASLKDSDEAEDSEEGEEAEEGVEALSDAQILRRAVAGMGGGLALCAAFSDPLVDSLAHLSQVGAHSVSIFLLSFLSAFFDRDLWRLSVKLDGGRCRV